MRRILLGSTALVGICGVAFGAAPELTISGSLNFEVRGGDVQANKANIDNMTGGMRLGSARSGWDFDSADSRSEIRFFAEGSTDDGTTYGASIDYRYLVSETDEAYIFVSADWGTIHLGQDDGAVSHIVVGGDSVAVGGELLNGNATSLAPEANDTGDSQKISYLSPDFSGFRFGTSVAGAVAVSSDELPTERFEDIYELALRYDFSLQDVDVVLSGGYLGGKARNDGGDNKEDLEEYVVGMQVNYETISLGASYSDEGDSGLSTADIAGGAEGRKFFNVGLTFDIGGGLLLGVGYADQTKKDHTGNEETTNLSVIDFGFPIMRGMSGYAGVARSEFDNGTERDGVTYVLGTTVSF